MVNVYGLTLMQYLYSDKLKISCIYCTIYRFEVYKICYFLRKPFVFEPLMLTLGFSQDMVLCSVSARHSPVAKNIHLAYLHIKWGRWTSLAAASCLASNKRCAV